MRPIVRRRDLDPAGKLSAADAYEIAQWFRARGARPAYSNQTQAAIRLGPSFLQSSGPGGGAPSATRPRSLISVENRDLRFGRRSPRGLQKSGLVVVEPGIARGLLGLFGKGGDGLGATDFLSGDAEVAGCKAVAALLSPAAGNLCNLPRFFRVTLLRREFRVSATCSARWPTVSSARNRFSEIVQILASTSSKSTSRTRTLST